MKEKANWFQRTFGSKQLADQSGKPNTTEKVIVVHRDALGSAGTRNFAGFDHEEYLSNLRGYQRADEFDKMRRSDTTIKMLLDSVKNIIRSGTLSFEPGTVSDEIAAATGFTQEMANADAKFIEHVHNDMDAPLSQFLNESLTMVDFGHAVFEVTQKIVENHPTWGTYVGIKNAGFRSPRTILKWNLDKDTGNLKSITQLAYGELQRQVDIPAEFLMIMTLNREGANFEGISWLRSCYGSYKRKMTSLKLNAIGIEKFAIPTPIAKVPQIDTSNEQYNNLVEVLENFVSHESQYITFPKEWDVTLVPNTYDPQKVEVSIDNEDKRMVNSFLANFLSLANGGGGSFALSRDLSDFFLTGLDHIATIICEEDTRAIIIPTIKANKGERPVYPKMKISGISDKAGKELAESVKAFVDAQVIIPDDQLEKQIREQYGLSKASKEGQRKPQDKQPYPLAMSENSYYKQIKLAEKRRMK